MREIGTGVFAGRLQRWRKQRFGRWDRRRWSCPGWPSSDGPVLMVEVRESTIVDAPVEEVWRVLRDFSGHDRWHPAIARSEIEGGAPVDAVGADARLPPRRRRLPARTAHRALDDERTLSYRLLEAPLPLMGYVATIALEAGHRRRPHTSWEWRSTFAPPAARRDELVRPRRRRDLPGRLRGDPAARRAGRAGAAASWDIRPRRRAAPARTGWMRSARRRCARRRSPPHPSAARRPAPSSSRRHGGPEVCCNCASRACRAGAGRGAPAIR